MTTKANTTSNLDRAGQCLRGATIASILALLPCIGVSAADLYQTRVVVKGLTRPTGIVAQGNRTLYVTQLPTPGVAGPAGGLNTVSKISLANGKITTLTKGEPEPTNLAIDRWGTLYWTCKSAGVILERNRKGTVSVFLNKLEKPSGIAVDRWGDVFFTLLPTPGVPGTAGGRNTVNVVEDDKVVVLAEGEPEPTDIAVNRKGDAYWTCKSAGVILMRSAKTSKISLLIKDLHSPTGIALDSAGERLYFTEVPTPGVSGKAGGSNRVSVLDLEDNDLQLVNAGDPEPTDITVAQNGRVYWTCSSAGVIVEARRLDEDYDED